MQCGERVDLSDLPVLSLWRGGVSLFPRQLEPSLPGRRSACVILLGYSPFLFHAVASHVDSSKDDWLLQLCATWKGFMPYMDVGGVNG